MEFFEKPKMLMWKLWSDLIKQKLPKHKLHFCSLIFYDKYFHHEELLICNIN